MKVIDASVLCDFLLGRSPALEALAADGDHRPLHSLELAELETLNALRRLARSGRIDGRRADEAVADLADLRLVRYPHAPLRARVWELRDELTAYDAAYLALAEALGEESVLFTGDRGLALRAGASLGDARVRHIG